MKGRSAGAQRDVIDSHRTADDKLHATSHKHSVRSGDWSHLQVCLAHTRMAPRLAPALAEVPGLQLVTGTGGSVPDADVVIGYHFAPGSLADLGRLRWVHLTGTGTEHLEPAGLAPDVLVTTSAAVPVAAVAEYALSGLMLLAKDLVDVAARQACDWYTSRATMLAGSAVAVVGAGRIGRAVISRLGALGAYAVAVTRPGAAEVPGASRTMGIDQLAAEAATLDHLIGCLPGGSETAGLISAEVLAALPPHAVVVNVGRASTMDTPKLHSALRKGQLRGAFVDVHEVEPLPSDDPAWSVPNLVISPHRAFCFPDEPEGVAAVFLDNLGDLRGGRTPRDLAARPAERTTQ